MPAWIGALISAIVAILKGVFGTDKPMETEVKHEKPNVPVGDRSDDDMLADLGIGVRPDPRPKGEDDVHADPPRPADGGR